MRVYRLGFTLSLLLLLSACQTLGLSSATDTNIDPNSLEALQPAVLRISKEASLTLSLPEVIESYTRLLPLLRDPETQMRVLHRLADLKMQKGEYLMAEQAVDELTVAITAYQGLLTQYPDRVDNDHVLYQLAKTYDLKGLRDEHLATLDRLVTEFPHSKYVIESQFRRGEILFTDMKYAAAQNAFESVVTAGESVFQANAYYMNGWSLFKQNKYEPALVSYSRVLDLLLLERRDEHSTQNSRIDQKHKTMIEDLLRVMGLSFSYLGGADSLAALFDKTGPKDYETLVYDRYSEFLIEKEQYTDAIAVYKSFIARHPLSIWSPKYHIKVIEVLGLAGFKRDIYQEKVGFVGAYGMGSEFWVFQLSQIEPDSQKAGNNLDYTKAQLERLLPELADLHYVKAQSARKQKSKKKANAAFTQSAFYNRAFVDTFAVHEHTAKRLFLLAESELQLGNWVLAIEAFERAGYEFQAYDRAAESAYASILAYNEYSNTWLKLPEGQLKALKAQQQASRLKFVSHHTRDKRAVDVLFIAGSYEFVQKQYANAINYSQKIIDWPSSFDGAPSADKASLLEAHLIKAHSYYAMADYLLAEGAYQGVLNILPKKNKRYLAAIENLAACVYKQAEALLAEDKKELAIDEFLRVAVVAPSSTLRASAEYDAAGYLLELKLWPRMIKVLTDFRKRYPKHILRDTIPAKLALAYRETKQWELAAGELKVMRSLANTEEEKQDILFIVSELYDKAENSQQAILSYRLYANTYPEPADTYMEATQRLAELYKLTNKPLKRRFWLAKQMKKVDALGDKADDRMRYLAAGASSVLAEDAFIQYKRIKLTLPLNKTMIKKTAALQKAMKAYQNTASYGVSQFSTEAGYRMADIYAQLSVDLMDSDRPEGLNELELEQYDILLEEQAYPFEDSAIDIHEQNASRSWNGLYDDWVKNSFKALKALLPGRYAKDELEMEAVYELN